MYDVQPGAVNKGAKFPREASLLKGKLGDLVTAIGDFGGVIAGGAVTSVFTNKEVNDLDVYFPDAKRASQFVAAVYSEEFGFHQFVNATTKCLMFVSRDTQEKFQLIYYKFHPTVEDIFRDFDFTINMGAYDPKTDSFILHEDFLRHNAQRTIQVNTNTAYPIISVLRTQKYRERGYHVSKPQLIRLLLAISQLQINSWDDLKDQLGGMYGYNADDIFPKDEDYSLEKALELIDKLSPKILEASNYNSMDFDDIQKATVNIFPPKFQEVIDTTYRFYDKKDNILTLERYAYPDPLQHEFAEVNEDTENNLPF